MAKRQKKKKGNGPLIGMGIALASLLVASGVGIMSWRKEKALRLESEKQLALHLSLMQAPTAPITPGLTA